MNQFKIKKIATALAIMTMPLLAGCGQNPSPTPPVGGGGQNLPGNPIGGGCAPISQPIPFQAQGIYADWANVIAGRLPYTGQMIGQVQVGGGGGAAGQYNTRPGAPDGALSLNLLQGMGGMNGQMNGQIPVPYTGYPNQYTAPFPTGMQTQQWNPMQQGMVPNAWMPNITSATGILQISPQVQQDIMMRVQMGQIPIGMGGMGGMGMPGTQVNPYQNPYQMPGGFMPGTGFMPGMQQICVSGIAMNIGKWDTQRLIYGGQVYLYLNGTVHGYVLRF